MVGIDDFSDSLDHNTNVDRSARFTTFDICRAALGYDNYQCWHTECSVYDIAWLGKFDTIFAFGLLYHLRHPLLALETLRKSCSGTLYIETAILDGVSSPYTGRTYSSDECVAEIYPNDEFGRNSTNWHVGTLRYWSSMVQAAGFTAGEAWRLTENPTKLSECRGFIRARVK